MSYRAKIWLTVSVIFLVAFGAANLDYPQFWNKAGFLPEIKLPFRLGLDLQGGTHLIYKADLAKIEKGDYQEAMAGVRDVIERRVNMFGVAEPVVQVEKAGSQWRLIVELAGVKDVSQAVEMIGETPYLDFRLENPEVDKEKLQQQLKEGKEVSLEKLFIKTKLDGRYLKGSQLTFNQTTQQPEVSLEFNDEGRELFAQITSKNVGKMLAIFLDGQPISTPVVREKITQGKAVISGDFTIQEAKQLVRRLNAGALPVPITLISQRTIGASLGQEMLTSSISAAFWGVLALLIFLVAYYRLPGVAACVTLGVYGSIVLAVFKLIPVTLTLSGIAGFILSLGMAVDANVLIFERLKEELARGQDLDFAIDEGFRRAWPSIRDGNFSTLITAGILYWIGVGFVQGFALTLGIGVAISMFTAVFFTRRLLEIIAGTKIGEKKILFKTLRSGALMNNNEQNKSESRFTI